jgi:putative selenium metabolism protein SsnA
MLLRNAQIIALSPPRFEHADLRVVDGTVTERRTAIRPRTGEESVDLSGMFVMPGMVCAHTHLYSSLARGMAGPKHSPRNFVEILKSVWWRLDEALDEESIFSSALAGALEAVRCGTTTIIDHHASPNAIHGSLDLLKEAAGRVGVRGLFCYETTDRGGTRRRNEGLAENERFVTENTNNSHFRGTIGAHASFTLNDDTLRALGDLAGVYDCGVHIHLAEDRADAVDARRNRGMDIVKRLERFRLLGGKSILAHGVHLTKEQCTVIGKTGAWLVHNPRSNMNNAVGYAPLRYFGPRTALGTDGFPADMFEEFKIGFFKNVESNHKVALSRLAAILNAGQSLVSEFFGRQFGTLAEGSVADLIVLDYKPPTPVVSKNLPAHLLFGMNSGMVESVMVDGRWVMWERRLVGLDADEVMEHARKVAQRLWNRMQRH